MSSPNFAPGLRQLQRVSIERGALVLSAEHAHAVRNHLQALYGYIELDDKPRAIEEWRELKRLVEGE